jgi:hypothetical protein
LDSSRHSYTESPPCRSSSTGEFLYERTTLHWLIDSVDDKACLFPGCQRRFAHQVCFYCLFVSVSVISDIVDLGSRSAVDLFSVAFIIAPFAMVAGGSISATKIYRPQNIIAWSKPANQARLTSLLINGILQFF